MLMFDFLALRARHSEILYSVAIVHLTAGTTIVISGRIVFKFGAGYPVRGSKMRYTVIPSIGFFSQKVIGQ